MIQLPSGVKVYIATKPVDMRKSHDGLSALIQTTFQKDTLSGHLFVFFGQSASRVKILYWDHNGYVLWYKRLEKGQFSVPKSQSDVITVNTHELCLLLEGIDLTHPHRLRAI